MAHYSLLNNDDRGDIETFLAANVQCNVCHAEQVIRVDDAMDGTDWMRHDGRCRDGSRVSITTLDWYYAFKSEGFNRVDDPEGPFLTEMAAKDAAAEKVAELPPILPPCSFCGRDDGWRQERKHVDQCVWGCRADFLGPCLSAPEGAEILRCSRERDHEGDHVVCRTNEDHSITHEVERWLKPAEKVAELPPICCRSGAHQPPAPAPAWAPRPPSAVAELDWPDGAIRTATPTNFDEALGALAAARDRGDRNLERLIHLELAARNAAYKMEGARDATPEGWRRDQIAEAAADLRAACDGIL